MSVSQMDRVGWSAEYLDFVVLSSLSQFVFQDSCEHEWCANVVNDNGWYVVMCPATLWLRLCVCVCVCVCERAKTLTTTINCWPSCTSVVLHVYFGGLWRFSVMTMWWLQKSCLCYHSVHFEMERGSAYSIDNSVDWAYCDCLQRWQLVKLYLTQTFSQHCCNRSGWTV